MKPTCPPNAQRPLKALLFDHDGVLVTSEELHFLAWQQLIRELGLPWEKMEIQKLVGRPAPLILKALLDEFKPGWSAADYDVDDLALRKNNTYLEYAKTQLAAYPGVREGLQWAKENGIPCAVVSNARRRELDASLSLLNLREYFAVVMSRDDVSRPKPDPMMFERAALEMGADPSECIAIDDSPTGLEGALLAGCRTASITTNYPRAMLEYPVLGKPNYRTVRIVDTMDEFFDWVREEFESYSQR